jgi:hypothetical protein
MNRNGNGNGSDDYALRQQARDREYVEAYRAWVRSLTPAQFQELERARIAHPDFDRRTYTPPEPAQMGDRPAPIPEPEREPTMTYDAPEAVTRLVLWLMSSHNIRLDLYVLGYLFGFTDMMGLSQEQIAGRFGLCKAAFSKRVKRLQAEFNVRPSRAMKSLAACAEYKLTCGSPKQHC